MRVAVIGGRPHAVMYAKELGIDVVLVHEEGKYEDIFAEYCERIVHAPITDPDAMLAVLRPLHQRRPFEQVITTSEDGAVATTQVAAALGLPGNDTRASRTFKNKLMTRRMLDEHGLSPVRHQIVNSAEDAFRFVDSLNGPFVLKPVDGTASANVHIGDDREDASMAWKTLSETGFGEALIEEYLSGPMGSVESFSVDGRHLTMGITEYELNDSLVEVGISAPGPSASRYDAELRELTVNFLDAIGYRSGPSHTEYILTPEGPRIMESHDRMAGGGVPELIRRAYGLNSSRVFLSALSGMEELPTVSHATGGAAIRFFEPAPGVLDGYDLAESLDVPVIRLPPDARVIGLPGWEDLMDTEAGVLLQLNEGDTVPPIRAGWDRRMGFVLSTGRDVHDARANCERIREQVRFRIR